MILAFLLAYLIGSIPNAFLIGKFAGKIDIREHGSGNVGATNVFRVMGKAWGITAYLLDMGKGLVVTLVLPNYFEECCDQIPFRLLLGLAAIIGHTFPIWLKFKGGKGVATSSGALLGIYPKALLGALFIWVFSAFVTRYVSVSSLVAAASFLAWLWLFYRGTEAFVISFSVSFVLLIFIVWTHRTNIARLRAGTEAKIGKSS